MKLSVPILWLVKMNFLFGWGREEPQQQKLHLKAYQPIWIKCAQSVKYLAMKTINFYANSWWVLLYNKINKYESSSLKILCCPLRATTTNTAGRHSPFHLWALFAWLSRFLRGSGVSWLGGLVCVLIGGGSSWSGAWRWRRGAGL